LIYTSGRSDRCARKGAGSSWARSALRCGVCAIGLSLLSIGCATQPYVNSHIESVNAEYRHLEDYVYALEDENARLVQENETLRTGRPPGKALGDAAPGRGGLFRRAPGSRTPGSSAPEGATPRTTPPARDATPGFEPPVIELPGDTPPRAPGRSTTQRPEMDSPADTPPNAELPLPTIPVEPLPIPGGREIRAPVVPDAISPKPVDKKITHLFLNPLTGGTDFDGQPGDDGLRIVVEPRNAGDQFVAEAGALSVVLLDPERQGEAARIARWDFDQSATRQALAASSPGRGMKLEVPWPAAAPAATRLKLFVRYEAPDGRKLQAEREVFVTPPGQTLSRWTPRPAERPIVQAAAEEPVPIASRPAWSPNR
jgi:hypothetical protein